MVTTMSVAVGAGPRRLLDENVRLADATAHLAEDFQNPFIQFCSIVTC